MYKLLPKKNSDIFVGHPVYAEKKRRENIAEIDRGSYYNQVEWLEKFLDNKSAFYNGSESDDSNNDEEDYNENIGALVRRCSSK